MIHRYSPLKNKTKENQALLTNSMLTFYKAGMNILLLQKRSLVLKHLLKMPNNLLKIEEQY